LRWDDDDPGQFRQATDGVKGLVEKLTLCTVTAASTAAQDEPELSVVCLSDLPAEIDNALDTYLSMIKAAGLKEAATPDCEVREWAAAQLREGYHVLALCTTSEPAKLVGCVTVSEDLPDRVAVCDLALEPERRGKGYGTSLLRSMQRAAASCGLGLALNAVRGRLLWYCEVLGFEFCHVEDAVVHSSLAPSAAAKHGRPLMPQHVRVSLELKLLAGVQHLESFNGGDKWMDAAMNELNAHVDTVNRAATARNDPSGHVTGPVRLYWCSLLYAMRREALRSPPPLPVLLGCQDTCAEALRQIDIRRRAEQQRERRLEREKHESEQEEVRRAAAAQAQDQAAAAAEAAAAENLAAGLAEGGPAAAQRCTRERAAARQQLGLTAAEGDSSTPLTLCDLVSAYNRQVEQARGKGNEHALKAQARSAFEVLVSADPALRAITAADADADMDMGSDLFAAAEAANECAAKAQALSEAEMRVVLQRTPSGSALAKLANFAAEALQLDLQQALAKVGDAHLEAVGAARNAETALGDLGGRIVGLGGSGVRGPQAVPWQLLQRERATKLEAEAAATAVLVITRHLSSLKDKLATLRDRLDGPTAEERKKVVSALVEHFAETQPTLEGVLLHVPFDNELRREACRDDVRRAVNCWRGRSVLGVLASAAPLTQVQERWQLHPAWAQEHSIDDGADRAAARFAADLAVDVFCAGAMPEKNTRSPRAQPTDGNLAEVALRRAQEMGASWWTRLPEDAAVVCSHGAFIEAYFTGVDCGTSPSIEDALDHLLSHSCYGTGKPAACGLCKRLTTFRSRLLEVAEAGAELPRQPWSFFEMKRSVPGLLFSTKRGVAALKAGAALCASSGHTLLKRKRVERCLAPRPSCCDVLVKIRELRLKGFEQCVDCGLHLPDELQPGCVEAIDHLQKQAKGRL